MKIVSPSKPKEPKPIMGLGRYQCRDCEAVYDVETDEDILSLSPKPSWASLENSKRKLVEVTCPCCKRRVDSITVKKGWFS